MEHNISYGISLLSGTCTFGASTRYSCYLIVTLPVSHNNAIGEWY